MSRLFLEDGESIPVTAISVCGNFVADIKTKERNGYSALVVAKTKKSNNLKKSQTIEINNQLISVEHGDRFGHHADHNGLRQSYPDSKLIIYGHTHIQACDQEKDPWVINPGACGHTRNNDGGPCFMQIEIKNDNWDIIPYCFN